MSSFSVSEDSDQFEARDDDVVVKARQKNVENDKKSEEFYDFAWRFLRIVFIKEFCESFCGLKELVNHGTINDKQH